MSEHSLCADAAASQASLSVNALTRPLLERLLEHMPQTGIEASRDETGVLIIDAGINAPGSVAAGAAIAEICMGGLGQVRIGAAASNSAREEWPTFVEISSAQPVLACLASQYAGWSLSASKEETGGKKFFSLGSGPARALAGKETLFDELGYRDGHDAGVLVMEVGQLPPQAVLEKIVGDCGLAPEKLTVIVTPTQSVAGTVQIVARVVEVALHKTHVLGVPLGEIVEASGTAPLPPPAPDGLAAMGRTNDAILYGGRVHLTVTRDAVARRLAAELPSSNSRDHGRPFAEIFASFNHDFYQIDPSLFAPAEVWVSSLESGTTYRGGRLDGALLHALWQGDAVVVGDEPAAGPGTPGVTSPGAP